METQAVSEEQIAILNGMISRAVDPTMCQTDRWQNGYANGLIAACNIIFGEEKPPILCETYTNEKAAEKISVEALILLRRIVDTKLSGGDLGQLIELASQLLTVWSYNSISALEQGAHEEEIERLRKVGVIEMPDSRRMSFFSLSELLTMHECINACEDANGHSFQHLGLLRGDRGLGWLVAVHEAEEGSVYFEKIGVVHSLPGNIKIDYV